MQQLKKSQKKLLMIIKNLLGRCIHPSRWSCTQFYLLLIKHLKIQNKLGIKLEKFEKIKKSIKDEANEVIRNELKKGLIEIAGHEAYGVGWNGLWMVRTYTICPRGYSNIDRIIKDYILFENESALEEIYHSFGYHHRKGREHQEGLFFRNV